MFGSQTEGYDAAQICLNGHEANSMSQRYPQFNKPFCDKCGEKTIDACPSCDAPIRGGYWGAMALSYDVPDHCLACGKPFPWTTRKQEAALEMFIESLDVQKDQQEQLKRDLSDIATDTPRTPVASFRIQKWLAKASKGAAGALRDIVVDIASETAKKSIWPDK